MIKFKYEFKKTIKMNNFTKKYQQNDRIFLIEILTASTLLGWMDALCIVLLQKLIQL